MSRWSSLAVVAGLAMTTSLGLPSVPPAVANPKPSVCAGQWAVQPSPSPARLSNHLNGVVAIASDDVWAVGTRVARGATDLTLAEHWDGTAWMVVPTPNPGTSSNELAGVAATSSNDVWAVGTQFTGSVLTTLVEHWDGISWSVSPSPNPSPTQNQLSAVSALSPTDVWAVGTGFDGSFFTLTEHWDGLSWSVVPSPNPGPYEIYALTGAGAELCHGCMGGRQQYQRQQLERSDPALGWRFLDSEPLPHARLQLAQGCREPGAG